MKPLPETETRCIPDRLHRSSHLQAILRDELVDNDRADKNQGTEDDYGDGAHMEASHNYLAEVVSAFPNERWLAWSFSGTTERSKHPIPYDCLVPFALDQAKYALCNNKKQEEDVDS
jgi:hypothetical protein